MGWVSLSLRKQSLRRAINDAEMQDIRLSRQLRSQQRQSAYDQSIFQNRKTADIKDARKEVDQLREKRGDLEVGTKEYDNWQKEYTVAKEAFDAKKLDIENYYDDVLDELEQEASDEEARIQAEQTEIEAQLEAMRAELQAVSDGISTDIQSTAIKLK